MTRRQNFGLQLLQKEKLAEDTSLIRIENATNYGLSPTQRRIKLQLKDAKRFCPDMRP